MKGIENITARILREAEAEVEEIRRRTKNQVEDINVSYDAICKQARQEALDAAREKAAEQEQRSAGTEALEHRKALLQEKQDLIDRAFQAAGEQLRAMPPERQTEVLAGLAASAAQGTEALVLNPADRAAFGPALVERTNALLAEAGKPASVTLAPETRDMLGGFVLREGDVEQNLSFEVLLRSRREEMALEVSRLLFD